jgi:hypothetical protein
MEWRRGYGAKRLPAHGQLVTARTSGTFRTLSARQRILLSTVLVSAISETASATLPEANLDAINGESGQPCESDHDCSLNGLCQDRRCQCDIPWSGVDCGVLQTRPAQRGGLYGYQQPGYWPNGTAKTSSWGGNILPSVTGGGWELFVAEIPRGLANWQHESRCIYATSPQRSGPFVKASVALPAECHNPQVLRERETGDYLLFHLGGSNPETGRSQWLSRSKSAGGPFLPANTSAVHACNNPAPAYHPNGSLYVICNHNQITHIPPGDEALRRGAWTPLRLSLDPHAPGAAGCGDPARSWEDPHLWFDSRGNWHIVYRKQLQSLRPSAPRGSF